MNLLLKIRIEQNVKSTKLLTGGKCYELKTNTLLIILSLYRLLLNGIKLII